MVSRLKSVPERFADALSCIDQCFIADEMLEQLPAASRVGKTIVGGIDLNKARMRRVIEALLALSSSPSGFTASEVAARVRAPLPSLRLRAIFGMMQRLDLTDNERAVLITALRRLVDFDPRSLSPQTHALKAILERLEPHKPQPIPDTAGTG